MVVRRGVAGGGGGPFYVDRYGGFTYVLYYDTYILAPPRPKVGTRLTPDSESQENSDLTQNVKRVPTLGLLRPNFSISFVLCYIKSVQIIKNAPKPTKTTNLTRSAIHQQTPSEQPPQWRKLRPIPNTVPNFHSSV